VSPARPKPSGRQADGIAAVPGADGAASAAAPSATQAAGQPATAGTSGA
jgi:hypothetical protein